MVASHGNIAFINLNNLQPMHVTYCLVFGIPHSLTLLQNTICFTFILGTFVRQIEIAAVTISYKSNDQFIINILFFLNTAC